MAENSRQLSSLKGLRMKMDRERREDPGNARDYRHLRDTALEGSEDGYSVRDLRVLQAGTVSWLISTTRPSANSCSVRSDCITNYYTSYQEVVKSHSFK